MQTLNNYDKTVVQKHTNPAYVSYVHVATVRKPTQVRILCSHIAIHCNNRLNTYKRQSNLCYASFYHTLTVTNIQSRCLHIRTNSGLPLFHRHTDSSLSLVFTHAVPRKTPIFAHTQTGKMCLVCALTKSDLV